jgi:hypothetical protein
MTAWILLTISVLADLVSLVEVVRTKGSAHPIRRWGWPFALVAMTALATYQALALHSLVSSRHEATVLMQSWPDVWRVENLSDGENIGIVLGGLRFLERHQKEYPETYSAARALLQGPLGHVRVGGADPRDSHELAEAAAAMIRLVMSVAEE